MQKVTRTLDGDLQKVPEQIVALYLAQLFHHKVIEWMVATNQVQWLYFAMCLSLIAMTCSLSRHLSTPNSINVALHANHGVSIPGQKSTWQLTLHLFKGYLTQLRAELCVSITPTIVKFLILHLQGPTVQGEISLTCDAWQASNMDGYFAVTAQWIQASTLTTWVLSSALIGFTCLNNAYVSVHLGPWVTEESRGPRGLQRKE